MVFLSDDIFPTWDLLPRKETGVVNLLAKNPEYDGRGTVIAIFDSGVDPSAPGLQITTDGKPKVIDRIDPSGAGDVDTSLIAEPIDGILNGLTGRTLKVPESWVNPTGKYHLGCKSAYSLYPSNLKDRVIKERKERLWDPVHKTHTADAQRNFQAVKTALDAKSTDASTSPTEPKQAPTPTDANGSLEFARPASSESSTSATFLEKLQKDNAEAKVTLLNSLEKKYNDLGPLYDCIVFHDGEVWRACIDTSESGDLAEGILLGEFRKTHETAKLTATDQFTISINVHNEGNKLEIVGMCSGHGTHVASITAANFPDNPEKNGIAPGAQIVAITIGDNRLGSMETVTALVRAMIQVMENPHYKIDVINMSYGEHAHWCSSGRFGDLAHDVVNKYGVIWVASAGNHGPALCTVGVPPDIKSDSIIGVGAYVSPSMMTASYSMLEKLPGAPYTWSSRGPTMTGGRGVTICAPGGAITSVPNFSLRQNQLMNGTSMAAPHTTGCISLLVSALKQKGIPYSPYSIRRAIENTAQHLEADVFAQGHGLIQIDRALEFHSQYNNNIYDKVRFSVEIGKYQEKGIHLRNWMADKPTDCNINIEPVFLDDQRADQQDKLSFNVELVLTCDASWIKVPSYLQMAYVSRNFKVSIDPRGLQRGQVYFSSIKAFLAGQPDRGFVFEIPVTMVVPELSLINNLRYFCPSEHFRCGRIRRHFIAVPLEASWASISLKATGAEKTQRLTLHAIQMKTYSNVCSLEFYRILNIFPDNITTHVFRVQGGLNLEVCLARWWSSLVDGDIELTLDFHSIIPTQEEISCRITDPAERVDVRICLNSEDVHPLATLKSHAQVLTPNESKIEVLGGDRDTIPIGREIYQLVLSYNFSISKSGVEVTPKCEMLSNMLYESVFESQLWMLFDNNKQHLGSGDGYWSKYSLKLDKGDYTLRMHVRHEHYELLDKLTDMPFTIITKLPQEVKLDIYPSYNSAITSNRKVQCHTILKGCSQPYYMTPPSLTDKNLKNLGLTSGHYLIGNITFSREDAVKKVVQYPIQIFITEAASKKRDKSSAASNDDKKEPKTLFEYGEAIRDARMAWITKLDDGNSKREFDALLASFPDHLPIMLARIQAIENNKPRTTETNDCIVQLADDILTGINVHQLLAFYGTKTDTRPDAAKFKLQIDKQKNTYLEAVSKKGIAICFNLLEVPASDRSADVLLQLDGIASDLLKFAEPADSKVINYFILFYQLRDFNALSARLITKQAEDKWTKENEAKLVQIYRKLGWEHSASLLERSHNIRFPCAFLPF